jgi:hypothetical protein
VNVHDNKLSGINCQGSGADKSINHVITAPRAYNNNTDAVSGVGNIYLSNLSEDITILGGIVDSNNTSTNGVRMDGTARGHKIYGLAGGAGIAIADGRLVVSISGITTDDDVVVRDVSSLDSDTTICGGNASVFISRVNASGKRIGQGTVAPTTGTWVAGDILLRVEHRDGFARLVERRERGKQWLVWRHDDLPPDLPLRTTRNSK